MFREDGSFDSSNNPIKENRHLVRDFGLYAAQIREVIYPDDIETPTDGQKQAPEVAYEIIIVGGPRDGQVFPNATTVNRFGGRHNFEEIILKKTTTLLGNDPASMLLPTNPMEQLNGDVVYIQFLNGDPRFPIIIGTARHPTQPAETAQSSDKQRLQTSYNGVTKTIDKDGVVTWEKAKGKYVDTPTPDKEGNLVQDTFLADLLEESVKVTLDNDFVWSMEMLYSAKDPLKVEIDGKTDKLGFALSGGLKHTMEGEADKATWTTKNGLTVTMDGTEDKVELKTKEGTSLVVDGKGDIIDFKTAAGDSIAFDGKGSQIAITDSTGNKFNMGSEGVSLLTSSGAGMKVDAAGLCAFGNSTAELLEIIDAAITALSTQTAPGFGAPTSTVPDFIQLIPKIKALKGSL